MSSQMGLAQLEWQWEQGWMTTDQCVQVERRWEQGWMTTDQYLDQAAESVSLGIWKPDFPSHEFDDAFGGGSLLQYRCSTLCCVAMPFSNIRCELHTLDGHSNQDYTSCGWTRVFYRYQTI